MGFWLFAGYEVLRVEKIRLFDAVFNLCAYKHPDNISLPKGSVVHDF